MLVVEDTEANEVVRFLVLDAAVQLGEIRVGDRTLSFDPSRVLGYFRTVEDRLSTLANKHPESFRYVPRRAYSYLMRPPILADLCEGVRDGWIPSWLVDQFMLRPITSIQEKPLGAAQRSANTAKVREWAFTSNQSARFYIVQDLRGGGPDEPGWGCLLKATDLSSSLVGLHRNDIAEHITRGTPIFVEIASPDEISMLLEWLVRLKGLKLPVPSIIIQVKQFRGMEEEIGRLLDIPSTMVTTSGTSVAVLSGIIEHLKEVRGKEWSTGLVFASSYPETQSGDSIAEILSYLLSKKLGATPSDLQRILGGNVYCRLPPVPPFLRVSASDKSVVAGGTLGKIGASEIVRMMSVLSSMSQRHPVSLGFMTAPDGSQVDMDTISITSREHTSSSASAILLKMERDDTIRVSGWNGVFARGLSKRRTDLASTLIRTSTEEGMVLDSQSHLPMFERVVLGALQVPNPGEVLAALRFEIVRTGRDSGLLVMSPVDMRGIGVQDGQIAVVLDHSSGIWWAAPVRASESTKPRTVIISLSDAQLLGMTKTASVDIIRYQGQVAELKEATMAFSSMEKSAYGETSSLVYLHEDEIVKELSQEYLGAAALVYPRSTGSVISFRLAHSVPALTQGVVGSLEHASVNMRPSLALNEINVIVCLATQQDMERTDCQVKTVYWMRKILERMAEEAPEVRRLVERTGGILSRRELAVIAALYTVNLFMYNRTPGRMAIVISGGTPHKFSIQKGDSVQSFLEFGSDIEPREVRTSLVLTLLDCLNERTESVGLDDTYRMIAEVLEDFGQDRPTLIIVFADTAAYTKPESESFISAIAARERYRVCFLGLDERLEPELERGEVRSLRKAALNISSLSLQTLEEFILSQIETLMSGS